MDFSVINEKNNQVEGYALIKRLDKKVTAKGLHYLDIMLADKTGEINAKLWDYSDSMGTFQTNTLIKVRGTISPFNGQDQLRIEKIREVCDADNININDYVPSAEYDCEAMFNELIKIISEFKDEELKVLASEILNQNKDRVIYFPAAYRLHHAIRGGLLLHTLSIAKLAQGVCNVYPFVDKDLLLCGAILHDIGKTVEFNVSSLGIAEGYTVDGTLVGHLVRGAMEVRKVGEQLGISNDKIMLVEHMLLSHHGEPEYGAAVRPLFLEAELLSELDLMDARVYEITSAVGKAEVGEFSTRQWALNDRRLYNHGRTDLTQSANLDIE